MSVASQQIPSWATFLVGPVGYLVSPVLGFSLTSYGPALLVSVGSILGILLKYMLDELTRKKTRDEWRRLADKPASEWEDLVAEKPRDKWTTAEYRILALRDLRNAVKEEVVEKVVEKVKEGESE